MELRCAAEVQRRERKNLLHQRTHRRLQLHKLEKGRGKNDVFVARKQKLSGYRCGGAAEGREDRHEQSLEV